ncbi:hypothetical protein B9Z55_024703 [Caenorhabditis nigoni]|uniref:Uncharacterized protein n=1 Tax=Caenorhabditis nigoni TaxID=1611254 RepID=A0A2G5SV56_9PELO|nr:hypothetical protein B9Z55_024703 [Caenorhabditis nigoni]
MNSKKPIDLSFKDIPQHEWEYRLPPKATPEPTTEAQASQPIPNKNKEEGNSHSVLESITSAVRRILGNGEQREIKFDSF